MALRTAAHGVPRKPQVPPFRHVDPQTKPPQEDREPDSCPRGTHCFPSPITAEQIVTKGRSRHKPAPAVPVLCAHLSGPGHTGTHRDPWHQAESSAVTIHGLSLAGGVESWERGGEVEGCEQHTARALGWGVQSVEAIRAPRGQPWGAGLRGAGPGMTCLNCGVWMGPGGQGAEQGAQVGGFRRCVCGGPQRSPLSGF